MLRTTTYELLCDIQTILAGQPKTKKQIRDALASTHGNVSEVKISVLVSRGFLKPVDSPAKDPALTDGRVRLYTFTSDGADMLKEYSENNETEAESIEVATQPPVQIPVPVSVSILPAPAPTKKAKASAVIKAKAVAAASETQSTSSAR
jgi:hypothetical protein